MLKNTLLYIGVATLLILGGIFIVFQGQNPLPENQQSTVKESYGTNDTCAFTIYKPTEESILTPSPNISKEVQCEFKIHESLPTYIFQVIGEKGKNNIESIQILREGDSQPIQTFSGFNTYPSVERIFETQDINFDDYLDIRTPAWIGTAGFTGYQYWIFEPETTMFELYEQLATLANPRPDLNTQTVITDDAKRGTVRYKWQNRGLIEI
jgi:hypothetical protein